MGTRFKKKSCGKTCDLKNKNSSFKKFPPFQKKKKKKPQTTQIMILSAISNHHPQYKILYIRFLPSISSFHHNLPQISQNSSFFQNFHNFSILNHKKSSNLHFPQWTTMKTGTQQRMTRVGRT